ncbi:MAG: class I SAM-dependent methyltransferase, partial [Gemmatimonadota bacterium]|nr:class I SAM-dependent methyltransferase [Gemmatimonadota bacterium]
LLLREGRSRGWSRVVDLGSGTGSNVRYLSRRIPWAKEWTAVDHDRSLLDRIDHPLQGSVRTIQGDLGGAGLNALEGAHVVTASALLDLVSEDWVHSVVDRCVRQGAGVLFVLSYDGVVEWGEPSADDDLVLEAVNEHQRSDKGLGTALGPRAGGFAAEAFASAGYRVWTRPSPWVLRWALDAPLIDSLVLGWIAAAREVRPDASQKIEQWAMRRFADLARGVALRVGHVDVLALPASTVSTESGGDAAGASRSTTK